MAWPFSRSGSPEPRAWTQGDDFFDRLDALVATTALRIDRPRATEHPRLPDVVYPVDYGFLEGTTGGDGKGVDVFRGAGESGVVGAALTVDLKGDVEVKILLNCSEAEIAAVQRFLATTLNIGGLIVRRG